MPTELPLPDISIRQLEYLVAVDESATWAAAAQRVGVSASALSQGLAELERRIGVELFEPVGRRRVLRTSSQPMLDHARQVVSLTEDVMRWSDRVQRGESGRVRLGLIDVAVVEHFPDELRRFRTDRTDVDVTLSVAPSRTLLTELAAGRLDLVVCVEPPEPVAGVATQPLFGEGLVVYAPPGTAIGPPAAWGPWVLFPATSHTRRAVAERLSELGAPVDVAAESHQPDVIREMVELDLGWTVLPRSQGEVDGSELVIGEQILERQLVLARRANSVHDPAADELATLLRSG